MMFDWYVSENEKIEKIKIMVDSFLSAIPYNDLPPQPNPKTDTAPRPKLAKSEEKV